MLFTMVRSQIGHVVNTLNIAYTPEGLVAVTRAVKLGAIGQGTSVVDRHCLALGWEGHTISWLGGDDCYASHLAAAAAML